MDPITQFLLPFIPMGTLVVAMVALLRTRFPKIDGKYVYVVAGLVSVSVLVWMQLRTTGNVHKIDWLQVAIDSPVVFVLSVGGTSFIQKLQERSGGIPGSGNAPAIMDVLNSVIQVTSAVAAMNKPLISVSTMSKPVDPPDPDAKPIDPPVPDLVAEGKNDILEIPAVEVPPPPAPKPGS